MPKPAITTQPVGGVLYETNPVDLSVAASGTSVAYQWNKDGTAISGATSATYTIASATPNDSGSYTVTVTNSGGSVTSNAATITVQTLPDRAVAMPLISDGAPAHASSGSAATAVDGSGDTVWCTAAQPTSTASQWIAVDLSAHPVDKIMFQWSNYYTWNYETGLMSYDTRSYNLVADYTIEGNTADGGPLPTSGWVPLTNVSDGSNAVVTSNDYHSRQHLLQFSGYKWVRMSITLGNDSNAPCLNLEVHDASAARANDSWLIVGDSITAFAMGQKQSETITADGDTAAVSLGNTFPQLIHMGNDAASPNPHFDGNSAYFPVSENGGVGAITAAQVATGLTDNAGNPVVPIDRWLAETPATYIGVALGTNDVNSKDASIVPKVAADLETIVKKIHDAGKVPVVAKLIWSLEPTIQAVGPALNEAIDGLYVKYPYVVHGPDLWNALKDHPEYFRMDQDGTHGGQPYQDTLHPNQAGERAMREAWAKAMLATIYRP